MAIKPDEIVELLPGLPSIVHEVCPVPDGLRGSTILFFGAVKGKSELVIDLRTKEGICKRAKFGFTELGMWLENMCDLDQPTLDVVL